MNLHRTTGKADWVSIDPRHYSLWQKIAAATRGYVTPGNVTTLCGLALVAIGLSQIVAGGYWLGGVLVVVGRALDLVDGWLAELTQTKSPLGEIMDASADKIETFGAVIVLFVVELAPWWVLLALLVPHVVIAVVSLVARLHQRQLHPSRAGKISMALLWLVVFGFVLLSVYDSRVLSAVVYGIALLTALMTLYATVDYGMQLVRRQAK